MMALSERSFDQEHFAGLDSELIQWKDLQGSEKVEYGQGPVFTS